MEQKSFLALTALNFIFFAWAIRAFFRRSGQLPGRMKVLQAIGLIGVLGVISAGALRPSPPSFLWAAILLNLKALALFLWALKTNLKNPLPVAFEPLKSKFLVMTGPYRIVRNPFYLSYILFWIAGFLGSLQVLVLLPIGGLFYLYWKAAVEEEVFLATQFGKSYEQYLQSVGRFFPKL